MDKRRPADNGELGDLEAPNFSRGGSYLGNPSGVTDQVGGCDVGEVAHRLQRPIDRPTFQSQLRNGLAGEYFIPRRRTVIEGKDLPCLVCELVGDVRVEGWPFPSQRSATWTKSLPTSGGRPKRVVSIWATSQIAAIWSLNRRDQSAVQSMLEGDTDAEVSREREGRDHFRSSDALPTPLRFF